nr:MAG TPA: hypothetical protein [Caudoviricetes sp.]
MTPYHDRGRLQVQQGRKAPERNPRKDIWK